MDLKNAFELAMKGEIEGRELYTVAAEKSEDEKAKEVFAYLAKEENSHLEALTNMYHSFLKGEELLLPKLPRLVTFDDAKSPIFSRDFKGRLGGRHFEMSALSIGLKLEQDAFRYYEKMSIEVEDDGLKSFFKTLSAWEKDHYDALNKELEYLEDDYFRENSFSPF
jgi:rubrerythrin